MPNYTDEELKSFASQMLDHPFHRFVGLELVEQEPGMAKCRVRVDDHTDGGGGYLHGGILYALLDMVAFFAVIAGTQQGMWPRTHAASFSLMRAAFRNEEVELRAEVDKHGSKVAFVRCTAWVIEAEGEERLIASASITKSFAKT